MFIHWLIASGWLNFIGLAFNLAGAVVLAYGAITTQQNAERISRMVWDSNPAVLKDRLRQSRNSILGIALLVVGFALQLPGNWPH